MGDSDPYSVQSKVATRAYPPPESKHGFGRVSYTCVELSIGRQIPCRFENLRVRADVFVVEYSPINTQLSEVACGQPYGCATNQALPITIVPAARWYPLYSSSTNSLCGAATTYGQRTHQNDVSKTYQAVRRDAIYFSFSISCSLKMKIQRTAVSLSRLK